MTMINLHSKILRIVSLKGIIRIVDPVVIADKDPAGDSRDVHTFTVPINGVQTPCIPGTTMKGIFRSETEFQLKSIDLNHSEFNICNILDYRNSCGGHYARDLKVNLRKNNEKDIKIILGKFCLACQLYGSPSYRGRIKFADAYPTEGYSQYSLEKATGIAINRLSGAAKHGALFSTKHIEPESQFEFNLRAINLTLQQIALLFVIIGRINHGYRKIGGYTSKGFGQVSIELYSCELGEDKKVAEDFHEFPEYLHASSDSNPSLKYSTELVELFSGTWSDYIHARRRKN